MNETIPFKELADVHCLPRHETNNLFARGKHVSTNKSQSKKEHKYLQINSSFSLILGVQ